MKIIILLIFGFGGKDFYLFDRLNQIFMIQLLSFINLKASSCYFNRCAFSFNTYSNNMLEAPLGIWEMKEPLPPVGSDTAVDT